MGPEAETEFARWCQSVESLSSAMGCACYGSSLDVTTQTAKTPAGIGDCGLPRPPAEGDLTCCAREHARCRNLCRKLFDRLALLHGGFSDQRKGGGFGKHMRMHHLENSGKYDTT